MKLINIFCVICFATVGIQSIAKAQENESLLNRSFTGNIHFNYNIHNLEGFSDSPLCASCLDLKDGNSLSGGLKLGLLFHPERYLLGMEYRWGITAGLDLLNVKLENDKYLGNIISGNTVSRGLVHYSANTKIATLSIEPYAYFYPFRDIRSSIRIGLSAAIPIIGEYDFGKKVLTQNATFPDGTTESTVSGRKIDGKKIFFSIPIGARYDLYTIKNWTISPEISYYLPITNFQSESGWKIKRFEIGLNTEYRLSKSVKKAVLPPKHLPLQKLPEPEIINSDIASTSDWFINGNSSGREIAVNTTKYVFGKIKPVPAVFVFDKNSSTTRSTPDIRSGKSSKNLYLNISCLDTENSDIAKQRQHNIFDYLAERGFDTSTIKTTYILHKENSIRYNELLEEADCAVLLTADSVAFAISDNVKESFSAPAVNAKFKIMPKTETAIEQINGNITCNKFSPVTISGEETNFLIDSLKLLSTAPEELHLTAGYEIKNSVSAATFSDTLRIKYQVIRDTVINNLKRSQDGKVFNEYFLAFFDFDASVPYSYESNALNAFDNAINSGNKIEIMGLTDNFGTADYNTSLARKRVDSVLRKLNIHSSKVSIITVPSEILQPNNTVEGRMLNRSVVIRIYE